MVEFLTSSWLPILVAAVGVFVASFITHMVLPYHKSDMQRVPAGKEDEILDALRRANLPPGDYAAPHAGGSAGMKDPAFIAKATKGPLAFFTVAPGAAPSMGPYLGLWFVYCVAVSGVSAYVVWRIFGAAASFNEVFKLACVLTFLSYAMALPAQSIWYRRSWATTLKSMFDGAIYGVVTGAAFGYLWPK
jgi:hypothetical protein